MRPASDKCELKNICSSEVEYRCDSMDLLIPDALKNISFNKDIKACIVFGKQKLFDLEKACVPNLSVHKEDLYNSLTYNPTVICLNDQAGKDICADFLGRNSNLEVSFVDHFEG